LREAVVKKLRNIGMGLHKQNLTKATAKCAFFCVSCYCAGLVAGNLSLCRRIREKNDFTDLYSVLKHVKEIHKKAGHFNLPFIVLCI